MKNHSNIPLTPRENFLQALLAKAIKEYKNLLSQVRQVKPLKIIEITHLSAIPGETTFAVQVVNKNSVTTLTAAKIISSDYDLRDFSDFHAEMIRQAAGGTLIQFLKLTNKTPPVYQIVSKKLDRDSQQFVFTIQTGDKKFIRTAAELSQDFTVLNNMDIADIYDIGYTQGTETVLKEKTALLLAKNTHHS
jgi:hypothetical protein